MKAYKYQLTRNEKNDQLRSKLLSDAHKNGDFEFIISSQTLARWTVIQFHPVFYPFNVVSYPVFLLQNTSCCLLFKIFLSSLFVYLVTFRNTIRKLGKITFDTVTHQLTISVRFENRSIGNNKLSTCDCWVMWALDEKPVIGS